MTVSAPRHRLLTLAVLAALSPLAVAQDAPATTAEIDEPTTLDTIVVTAQKREEQLQDVPVVVTALSEQILQDTGVRDVKDLQVLVPGLTVTSTQSEAQTVARIRGIGTVGDNAGLESSVGIVIDGIYRPRNGVGFTDLGELERIEVLKGPQGTLFGKNTSAGVINVITKRPDHVLRAEGEFTVGNYGQYGLSAMINGPIDEGAAARIYAATRTRDGFVDVNAGPGPRGSDVDDFDQDFRTVRAQLQFDASDDVVVNLSGDFTSRDENCCTGVTIVRENTPGLPFNLPTVVLNQLAGGEAVRPTVDPYARQAYSNRSTAQEVEDKGVGMQIDWNTPWFNGATLTSVSGYREWQSINGLDFDFSTADLIWREPTEDDNFTGFETVSQEFRLAGSTDKVDWLFGAFYSDEDLDRNEAYRIGPHYEAYLSTLVGAQVLSGLAAQLAPFGITVDQSNPAIFLGQVAGNVDPTFSSNFAGLGAADTYHQNAKSLALFTNNTWHATDALDLTLGLRYTREDKELHSQYSNPNGSPACSAALANPSAGIAAALTARGVPFAFLPPATQAAILQAVAPGIVGRMCLPWTNALHDGRVTHQQRDEGEWSGTFKAAYRFNEQVMTYFSAARGYKAGGFNLDRVQSNNGLSSGTAGILPVDDTSFAAEFVDSYELGAKTTWMGGNLLLNGALFHQTYDDFQLNSFLGTSFVVRSIPEVVSRGIDAEVLFQTGGLFLQGGLTWAETEYGDDPLPDADLVLLPGNTASFAPELSATASLAYEWDVGSDLIARFHIGAKYNDDYNTGSDLDPQKMQEAYTVANARIGFGRRDRRWMVELWGNNITDTEYMQVAFDAPLQAGAWNAFLAPPRTYGVTVRLSY